ncbi:MAG TPA: DUF4867 family protein [Candidatus Scatomonas pullistercoris]|uniref:DUF4867 family protein n=1 Tax=Candidatus Scatomonas pullistercoris TaxID=2840920 RepID=A0A9D1P2D1_9FIRM|nr:DUF4867 family protein [Candidatus Scatomonas pullistercoris]
MEKLRELKALNPELKLYSVEDPEFTEYGKIVTGYDFGEILEIMNRRAIPAEGNVYVAKDEEMMKTAASAAISERFYGHMPIEIGYCNGNSYQLNAFEYHKGSEIDIPATDLVLMLGRLQQIRHNQFSSEDVRAFYVPAGTAVELYQTTLHFAPSRVEESGFRCVVILPDGTNLPLEKMPAPENEEDRLLWMQNKWLIAHKESVPASKGACVGITGINPELRIR